MLIVREFLTPRGRSPYREWFSSLDVAERGRVQARMLRFELGNFGDHRLVGKGVWEARLMFGPGYRVYFARQGDSIVVLLAGGDKKTQASDIALAQEYWFDYLKGSSSAETQH